MKKEKLRILSIAAVSVILILSGIATVTARVYKKDSGASIEKSAVSSGLFNFSFNGSRINKTIDFLNGINETVNNVTDNIIGLVEDFLIPVRDFITNGISLVKGILIQIRDLLIGA